MSISYSEKERMKNGRLEEGAVIVTDVIKESISTFEYFVVKNIGSIGTVFQIFIPYVCMLGYKGTGNGFIWFFIPLVMYYVSYIMKRVNMVCNNRTVDNIPIPYKRFTNSGDDGEVFIEEERLQEMLLYMEELENELERLGKI